MLYLRVVVALMLTTTTVSAEEPFKFKSKLEDDRVNTKVEKERTVIDVTSPTGISTLTVERTGEAWPERVVVRLRLGGLEHLHVAGGKASVVANVQSHADRKVGLVVDGKKEDATDPKGTYFMDFKVLGKNGKPATTFLNPDGYFEFRLPRPVFEGNPKQVKLEWVDFYRR